MRWIEVAVTSDQAFRDRFRQARRGFYSRLAKVETVLIECGSARSVEGQILVTAKHKGDTGTDCEFPLALNALEPTEAEETAMMPSRPDVRSRRTTPTATAAAAP